LSIETEAASAGRESPVGRPSVADRGGVATTFAGIKRAHRRPLGNENRHWFTRPSRPRSRRSATLPGLRDRALLLVGFAAALRPREIAGLTVDHLAHHADGIELFLPWRKNDQDDEGTTLWLPQGRTELCPVAALTPSSPLPRSPKGHFPAHLAAAAAAPRAHDSPHLPAFASVPTRSTPMRSR
jgi:hypothetical protein